MTNHTECCCTVMTTSSWREWLREKRELLYETSCVVMLLFVDREMKRRGQGRQREKPGTSGRYVAARHDVRFCRRYVV